VKTRSLAVSMIESGHVRVNKKRVETPAHSIRESDILTIALSGKVRILRVVDFSERRGKAPAAFALYEEIIS
jgi:ribosome-associated heat shock protein Hsp15